MGALRENGGKIENSDGGIGELASRGGEFAWLDFSGPVENGTDGVALFGHPSSIATHRGSQVACPPSP